MNRRKKLQAEKQGPAIRQAQINKWAWRKSLLVFLLMFGFMLFVRPAKQGHPISEQDVLFALLFAAAMSALQFYKSRRRR